MPPVRARATGARAIPLLVRPKSKYDPRSSDPCDRPPAAGPVRMDRGDPAVARRPPGRAGACVAPGGRAPLALAPRVDHQPPAGAGDPIFEPDRRLPTRGGRTRRGTLAPTDRRRVPDAHPTCGRDHDGEPGGDRGRAVRNVRGLARRELLLGLAVLQCPSCLPARLSRRDERGRRLSGQPDDPERRGSRGTGRAHLGHVPGEHAGTVRDHRLGRELDELQLRAQPVPVPIRTWPAIGAAASLTTCR